MDMDNLLRKILLTCIVFITSSVFCMAQSSVTHTVARGETLASIATQYGVTEKQIIEANPDAAQFIYVGMELTIPNVPSSSTDKVNTSEESNYSLPTPSNQNYNTPTEIYPAKKETYTPFDFCSFGISYIADFDTAGEGHYMIGGSVMNDAGWGADFHIGANYGLVDKDFAGVLFPPGPSYGHVVENVLISASLDFVGNYSGTGEGEKTGTNHKGEEYHYKGTDLKFGWGISLMPKAMIMLGKVRPWIGLNATWSKGSDKLGIGFQVGLGFDI